MADYNINAVTRKIVYSGSAGTGPYSFSFEILVNTDVAVYFNTTRLTLTTDYTVTINANGTGSVMIVVGTNVPTTPDGDDSVTIVGARDIERTTDFSVGGDLSAAAVNEQLDANIIFVQQVDERVDRAIKAAVTDPTSINMELPVIATRANKVLAFDANGDVAVSTNTLAGIESGATDAAASAVAADASATAAAASATTAANSAAAFANKYTFSTTTAMADPGTGILRFNNATYASVTAIAIDDLTADTNNPDINAYIATWDDSTSTIKGFLHIFEDQNPGNFAIFSVTGLTDNSGWAELAVSHIASNGTIDNTDPIRVQFKRTGDKGDTGATGATGATGPTGPAGGGASVGLVLALGG